MFLEALTPYTVRLAAKRKPKFVEDEILNDALEMAAAGDIAGAEAYLERGLKLL